MYLCLSFMPVVWFDRKSPENSSISLANYTATLDDRKCDISAEVITLQNMSELGVETLHISPFVQSEFWQGESLLDLRLAMLSILLDRLMYRLFTTHIYCSVWGPLLQQHGC